MRRSGLLLVVACAATLFFRLGSFPLLDDPNEGQYAEVAREMVESGEWLSPQLDYVLFLNKPPLTYWLLGASYRLFGVSELAARVPSAACALLIVLLVVWLGNLLFDPATGVRAGLILATTAGFFVESHLVRPDLELCLGITASFVALAYVFREGGRPRTLVLVALQSALAFGLLAKGMVALLVPALVALPLLVFSRRWSLARELLRPRAWWWFAVLVVPWHLVMSLRHSGFAWDYIVNQHLLFFFDKKEPRDSLPIPLWAFWAAFAGRMFPWTFFLPLAVRNAWRARRDFGNRLALLWASAVLLFFSIATARLEHYSIPALPALALLLAALMRDTTTTIERRLAAAHAIALLGAAAVSAFLAPLPLSIVLPVTITLAGGFAVAVLAPRQVGVAVAVGVSLLLAELWMVNGLAWYAPQNSSRATAQAVASESADAVLVFEAPIEYQNVAPLLFYLRRRIAILRPPRFIAPDYLVPHQSELFVSPEVLEHWWQTRDVLFLADPLMPRASMDAVVPGPYEVVWHNDDRWVLKSKRGSLPDDQSAPGRGK